MNTKKLSLVTLGILVCFLTASSVSAVPPDCDIECTCTSSCRDECTLPRTSAVITCRDWGTCKFLCRVAPPPYGTSGSATLNGGSGQDCISGYGGNDTVDGNAGDDRIYRGSAADTAYGESGDDCLRGDDGNDPLDGQSGHDDANGGSGTDTCFAEDKVNCP